MINKYLLILLVGHLLGDFYFQNDRMAKEKEEKYRGVCWHAIEYFVVFMVTIIPVFSIDMVLAAMGAGLIHFIIDSVKYILLINRKIKKNFKIFIWDQGVHLLSILILAYIMDSWNFKIGCIDIVQDMLDKFGQNGEMIVRWLLVILLIHNPINILIQSFLEDYKPKAESMVIQSDQRAGRRIGTVERLIMLVLISRNQYGALGLVLTAKSIARYDKITKDEKFAEYYLLGTLVSTLCVVVCGGLV